MFLRLFGKERGLCVPFPGTRMLVQLIDFYFRLQKGGDRRLSRPAVPHTAPGPALAALHWHLLLPTGSRLGP